MTRSSAPEVAALWLIAAGIVSTFITAHLVWTGYIGPHIEHRLDMEGPSQ